MSVVSEAILVWIQFKAGAIFNKMVPNVIKLFKVKQLIMLFATVIPK